MTRLSRPLRVTSLKIDRDLSALGMHIGERYWMWECRMPGCSAFFYRWATSAAQSADDGLQHFAERHTGLNGDLDAMRQLKLGS